MYSFKCTIEWKAGAIFGNHIGIKVTRPVALLLQILSQNFVCSFLHPLISSLLTYFTQLKSQTKMNSFWHFNLLLFTLSGPTFWNRIKRKNLPLGERAFHAFWIRPLPITQSLWTVPSTTRQNSHLPARN